MKCKREPLGYSNFYFSLMAVGILDNSLLGGMADTKMLGTDKLGIASNRLRMAVIAATLSVEA